MLHSPFAWNTAGDYVPYCFLYRHKRSHFQAYCTIELSYYLTEYQYCTWLHPPGCQLLSHSDYPASIWISLVVHCTSTMHAPRVSSMWSLTLGEREWYWGDSRQDRGQRGMGHLLEHLWIGAAQVHWSGDSHFPLSSLKEPSWCILLLGTSFYQHSEDYTCNWSMLEIPLLWWVHKPVSCGFCWHYSRAAQIWTQWFWRKQKVRTGKISEWLLPTRKEYCGGQTLFFLKSESFIYSLYMSNSWMCMSLLFVGKGSIQSYTVHKVTLSLCTVEWLNEA